MLDWFARQRARRAGGDGAWGGGAGKTHKWNGDEVASAQQPPCDDDSSEDSMMLSLCAVCGHRMEFLLNNCHDSERGVSDRADWKTRQLGSRDGCVIDMRKRGDHWTSRRTGLKVATRNRRVRPQQRGLECVLGWGYGGTRVRTRRWWDGRRRSFRPKTVGRRRLHDKGLIKHGAPHNTTRLPKQDAHSQSGHTLSLTRIFCLKAVSVF